MTNEEKAQEICNAYANSKFIPTQEECVAYSSAMEMAKWKDEQFKKNVSEYIEFAYNNGEAANLLEDLLTDI